MTAFKITGEITSISTSKIKEWDKINFVLKTEEEYNNLFSIELFGEKANEFGELIVTGSIVTVDFNIKTNEWQGKYYTNLSAWKIEIAEGKNNPKPTEQQSSLNNEDNFTDVENYSNPDDDLPF